MFGLKTEKNNIVWSAQVKSDVFSLLSTMGVHISVFFFFLILWITEPDTLNIDSQFIYYYHKEHLYRGSLMNRESLYTVPPSQTEFVCHRRGTGQRSCAWRSLELNWIVLRWDNLKCRSSSTYHGVCVSHSVMFNSVTPWIVAHQAPLSVGFSGQEYWSGLPFPPPGDLPDPGFPGSPALQTGSLPSEPPGLHPDKQWGYILINSE